MIFIIGLDPGPLTGACMLRLPAIGESTWYVEVAQLTPAELWPWLAEKQEGQRIAAVATERWVNGPRISQRQGGKAVQSVLGGLAVCLKDTRLIGRSAADVKPWATDARLNAAGLLKPTIGKRHARDACRHALFSACRDFGARIPREVTP